MKRQVVLEETFKRLKLAEKLAPEIIPSKAVLLVGSVAYGAYHSVTSESDLELICIIDRQDVINNFFLGGAAAEYLHSGKADIYKTNLFGYEFPTDVIFWTTPFFENVCNNLNFEFGIRFSEEDLSARMPIQLQGLQEQRITISRESKKTSGGYLTRYPVHHIEKNLYYFAGVPVENLLSNPKVLAGDQHYVDKNISKLWTILREQSSWESGCYDGDPLISNLLIRESRMPLHIQKSLVDRENSVKPIF